MKIVNRRIAALTLLGSLMPLFVTSRNWTPRGDSLKRKVATTHLPLSFEVNRGQAAADVKFVARGGGYALLLTDRGEPVLALSAESHTQGQQKVSQAPQTSKGDDRAVLRLQFPGGNPAPQTQDEQLLPGHINYLIGNDPRKWLTGVPHYARVRYQEVFHGVDVLYYVKDQQLEYDFIIRPGTNPDSIRMKVQGAEGIERSESGSLALKTVAGRVLLHRPVAYQQGPGGEAEVACNYLLDQGEIRFALGDYDHSQVLRIDPVLSYLAPMDAIIQAIAVDASGNSYLAGRTSSANFETTPGVLQSTLRGGSDAVIAKLDPTGSTLLFATYIGGAGNDSAYGIALDSSGNIFIAGSTHSTDLPVNHAFQSTLLGSEDAFLSKLNANGTQLLYSTYLGGSGFDSARGLVLDTSGRALVTGVTNSPNFPTSNGTLQAVYGGGDADGFVAELDTNQSSTASRVFSTYLGGSGEDAASAIAVDAAGFAFVTGMTRSANFPIVSAFQSACASCTTAEFEFDAFVSKLNVNGTALVYSTFLGGHARDIGRDIAVDSGGNTYVTGQTSSLNFPATAGAFQTSFHGGADAFVTKLNAAGSTLLYASYIGGNDVDVASGIALDSFGNAYLSGLSASADFPTVKTLQEFGGGTCDVNGFGLFPCFDAIIMQMNASGSTLIFSTYLGGGADDFATRVGVDAAGNAYVAGTGGGTSLSTLGSLREPEMTGTGFASKISPVSVGTELTAITLTSSPNPSSQGQSVTFAATVTPPAASGVVKFYVDNAPVGFATLNAGAATLTRASLSGGNRSIKAEYLGDATYAANTSAAFTQVVNSISLAATQTSTTVAKGGIATFPLTVDQTGTLTSAIAFSCSGLPAGWSCVFDPLTVPAGSGPTQIKLTVQTSGTTAQYLPRVSVYGPGLPANICAAVLVLPLLGFYVTAKRRKVAFVSAVPLGLLLLAAGCGSGSNSDPPPPQPPPVNFTVNFTVSATSDSTTTSMGFSITVK